MVAVLDRIIRRIEQSDVVVVVDMVHELAAYERAPQECHLTVEQLRHALFCDRPLLFGHVAEVAGEVVGFALWFVSFSAWTGVHGIYVEDLYVRPAHRGSGLGKAFKVTLAKECVRGGFGRLECCVLDWNPAVAFYRSIGGVPMLDWTVYRWSGPELTALAEYA